MTRRTPGCRSDDAVHPDSGLVDLGRFGRLSDYVNLLDGWFPVRDVMLRTRAGEVTRIALPELRIRLDDVSLIGQRIADRVPPNPDRVVPKERRRLVLVTAAHLVAGFAFVHPQSSLAAFIDATDPPFLPMVDVRVRWLADRRLTGRFAFALVQRSHIVGVGTDQPSAGGNEPVANASDRLDHAGPVVELSPQ